MCCFLYNRCFNSNGVAFRTAPQIGEPSCYGFLMTFLLWLVLTLMAESTRHWDSFAWCGCCRALHICMAGCRLTLTFNCISHIETAPPNQSTMIWLPRRGASRCCRHCGHSTTDQVAVTISYVGLLWMELHWSWVAMTSHLLLIILLPHTTFLCI